MLVSNAPLEVAVAVVTEVATEADARVTETEDMVSDQMARTGISMSATRPLSLRWGPELRKLRLTQRQNGMATT